MLQDIAKSALDLDALDRHVALFGLRQPVDLFHTLKTVKGLLYLVPPRTPRIGIVHYRDGRDSRFADAGSIAEHVAFCRYN